MSSPQLRRRVDCGYDHDKYRRLVRQRGVKPLVARRQTKHGSGLGRWVIERTAPDACSE